MNTKDSPGGPVERLVGRLRDAARLLMQLNAHEEAAGVIDAVAEFERLQADHLRMYEAMTWALGANGDFRAQGTMQGPYYWRGELAERAGLFWNGERYLHRPPNGALSCAGNKPAEVPGDDPGVRSNA